MAPNCVQKSWCKNMYIIKNIYKKTVRWVEKLNDFVLWLYMAIFLFIGSI